MKVRGACDKPLWIYKRLNNCAAPVLDSDDVLVVASLAYPAQKDASSSTTKTSSLSSGGGGGGGGGGRRNYLIACISKLAYRMHLGPSPFDSAPRTLPDKSYHFWVNFPFNAFFLISSTSSSGYTLWGHFDCRKSEIGRNDLADDDDDEDDDSEKRKLATEKEKSKG